MKTARLIAYLVLLADLGIFAGYRRLMHATNWSLEAVVLVFLFLSLGFVLLLVLYEIITFQYNDREKRKGMVLVAVVLLLGCFVWFNPFDWPLGHQVKLAGWWKGKPTSGKIECFEDGFFEITWNGLARDGFYQGRWKRKADTIVLDYTGEKLDRVGDTLLLTDSSLVPLNGYSDWVLRDVEFILMEGLE